MKTKSKEDTIGKHKCDNCGAQMDYIKNKKEFKCSYCGAETHMREVIENVAEEVGKTIAKEINSNSPYNDGYPVPKQNMSVGKKIAMIVGIIAGIWIVLSIFFSLIGAVLENVSDKTPPKNAVIQIVGKDISAGEYAMSSTNPDGYSGYVRLMEGQGYNNDNYVDSYSVGTKAYVNLVEGYTISCIDVKLTPVAELKVEPFTGFLPEGQYLCGIDFPAGNYLLTANPNSSYGGRYEVSDNPIVTCVDDGDVNEGTIKKAMQITIKEGQYISFSDCVLAESKK